MYRLSILEITILKKCKNTSLTLGDLLIDLLDSKNKLYNGFIAIGWRNRNHVLSVVFERQKQVNITFLLRQTVFLYKQLVAIQKLQNLEYIKILPQKEPLDYFVANKEHCYCKQKVYYQQNPYTYPKNYKKIETCEQYIPIPELAEFMKKNANSSIYVTENGMKYLKKKKVQFFTSKVSKKDCQHCKQE